MKFEVLICTLHSRQTMLQKLLGEFDRQISKLKHADQVKISAMCDDGEMTIGDKRQKLLEQACGDYIAFVDDDDRVAADYLERIMDVLATEQPPDCVGMQGIITYNGQQPELFEHSLRHDRWYSENAVHYRCPNHLNPARRVLALQAGFTSKNFGEDHDYSQKLRPLLKTEVFLDEPIYFYDYRSK